MTTIAAEVIKDSVNPAGVRLTTMRLVFPRFLLAQFNTHRVFSRNAASSRAIPVTTMIDRVQDDFYMPIWLQNQKGMQPKGLIEDENTVQWCNEDWIWAKNVCMQVAGNLSRRGVAKEQVNRLLEPFAHVQVLVTSTDWKNFFNLRIHHAAQQEMQWLATQMYTAMENSTPMHLDAGTWHLPFVTDTEMHDYSLQQLREMSTARCCRVSYWLHDGKPTNYEKDKERHDESLKEGHWSPFEHVAMATDNGKRVRNFRGWVQYRDIVDLKSMEG